MKVTLNIDLTFSCMNEVTATWLQICCDYCACMAHRWYITIMTIISGMAGYFLTDNKRVKTQYDRLTRIPASEWSNLVRKYSVVVVQS